MRALLAQVVRSVWCSCRAIAVRKLCVAGVVASASALLPSRAFAEDTGPLRLGVTGSLGVLAPPENPQFIQPDGSSSGLYSLGVGLDLRVGVQLGQYVALDAQLFGESALLAGDMRAAILLEVAPLPELAFALGGGVGSMFLANFFFDSPSADFVPGVLRIEGRVPGEKSDGKAVDVCFGLEGQLGYVFDGSLPEGTLVLGGRAFGGLLWH